MAQHPDKGSKKALPQGAFIHSVRNLDLAVCLAAVGVPLRQDPPYTYRVFGDGTKEVTYNFDTRTIGQPPNFNTADLIKAFTEADDFIAKNPMHPFTFALAAVRNRQVFLEHIKNDTPFIGLYDENDSGRTVYVKLDSNRHRSLLDQGYIEL